MIYEKFYDDCDNFFGWKCISCGEIVDPVILKNRGHAHSQHGSRASNLFNDERTGAIT